MTEKRVSEIRSEYLVDAATNQPKRYKLSELGLIPEDWSVSTVKDISAIPMQNGLFYEPKRKGKGVPLINVGDMYKSAPVNVESLELFDANTNEIKIFKAAVGDLFFTRSSVVPSGIAFCNIYNSKQENVVFDSHLIRVRPNKELVDPNYLYLNCIAKHARSALIAGAKTATMTTIDQGAINRCPVLLPPIKEQTAIANALSDVDALIQELEKLIAKKQAIKTATMQQLLTGRTRLPAFAYEKSAHHPDGRKKGYKPSELGEIPEDWRVLKLIDIATFINGKPYEEFVVENGKYQLITLDSVSISGVLKNKHKTVNFVDGSLSKGDLVCVLSDIAHARLLGLCGLIEDDGQYVLNQRMGRIRFHVDFHSEFMRYLINSKQEFFRNRGQGSSQRHIYKQDVFELELALPEKSEQVSIATVLSEMDQQIRATEQRLSKTRQIKQGMMQELLTGKTRLVKPAGAA